MAYVDDFNVLTGTSVEVRDSTVLTGRERRTLNVAADLGSSDMV
ncbi:hypothetical protein [Streptomyces sp. D2-8]|nr:hypothetical protein [Streptomyces sp. D2-8]